MAVREIKTTIALDGEQQFKKALADASREMRVMDSELKAVASAYSLNGDKMQMLSEQQKLLSSQIAQQDNIVQANRERLRQWGDEYDRLAKEIEAARKKLKDAQDVGDDKAAEELTRQISKLENAYQAAGAKVQDYRIEVASAETKSNKLKKTLSDTDREVEELGRDSVKAGRQIEQGIGDAAESTSQSLQGFMGAMQADLSAIKSNTAISAISGLWDMAAGAYTAIAGFVDGTVEYRRQLSFLKQNAETSGLDFSLIEAQLIEVQGFTGDASAAIEGLSNLLAAGFDEHRLAEAVDLLGGAVINFPETMKFESLAESIQETLATGEATGAFAEFLERTGVDLEAFNEAMENSETAAGDMDIVLAYLASGGMKQVYDQWQANNEAMVEAGETQAELEKELAKFGGTLEEYIVTPVKELLVDALKWVNDTVDDEKKRSETKKTLEEKVANKEITQETADAINNWVDLSITSKRAMQFGDVMKWGQNLLGIEIAPDKRENIWGLLDKVDVDYITSRGLSSNGLPNDMYKWLNQIDQFKGEAEEIAREALPTLNDVFLSTWMTNKPTPQKNEQEISGFVDWMFEPAKELQSKLEGQGEEVQKSWFQTFGEWLVEPTKKMLDELDAQNGAGTSGKKGLNLLDMLLPTAYAEEAEQAGAEAANAYYDGFADQIEVNEAEAEVAPNHVDLAGVPTTGEMDALLEHLNEQLQKAQGELEDASEEAGEAMEKGFASAWAELENKAYQAGVSAGAAYAEGLSTQMGLISAAAGRLSAAANASLNRASAIAKMGITLNMDGRKVAEGLVPYVDETMITYLNIN